MNMEEAINHAETVITQAINDATQAAWEAGRASGLDTAVLTAQHVADDAQTPQGKGAAGAVGTRIRAIIEAEAKG